MSFPAGVKFERMVGVGTPPLSEATLDVDMATLVDEAVAVGLPVDVVDRAVSVEEVVGIVLAVVLVDVVVVVDVVEL